jgi:hypothetical protein
MVTIINCLNHPVEIPFDVFDKYFKVIDDEPQVISIEVLKEIVKLINK